MGPAREGDQLRADFFGSYSPECPVGYQISCIFIYPWGCSEIPTPHHQQAYTHTWEDSDLILSLLSWTDPSGPLWVEAASEPGDFPVPSRPLSTKSSSGNWGVIIEDFSDWSKPNLTECGLGIFRIPSQLSPHHCSATQNSNFWDHLENRMILNRALILGALALTTMMSPSGSEDIVGECTVEGYGDWS